MVNVRYIRDTHFMIINGGFHTMVYIDFSIVYNVENNAYGTK